jgi:hypothetical protein
VQIAEGAPVECALLSFGIQRGKKAGIEKFQGLFKRSLKLNKRNWKKAVERVWEYYPDEKIVLGVIPEDDEGLRFKVKGWMLEKN